MAYSEKAKALRKCTAMKKDGSRCKAYAIWGHPRQVCFAHSGRKRRTHDEIMEMGAEALVLQRRGMEKREKPDPLKNGGSVVTTRYKRKSDNYQRCGCAAYPFPHRPGGGYCRWPDEPRVQTERVKEDWGASQYGIEVVPISAQRRRHISTQQIEDLNKMVEDLLACLKEKKEI